MTGNAAEDLAAAVRGAAEAVQACLIDGFPEQVDRSSVPLVRLKQEDAARLIGSAAPKAVYLVEVAFDPEEAINDVAEALAGFGVEKLPPSLKAAHRRVADRAGEICTTLVAFMVDGVMHTAFASASWHEAFEEAVDETVDAARAEAETRDRGACDRRVRDRFLEAFDLRQQNPAGH